jgi:hypothetical protein
MHWLGPYVIKEVTKEGVAQLETLNGEVLRGLVNGSWLKLYREGRPWHNKGSCTRIHIL